VDTNASTLPVSNKQKMSAERSLPDNKVILPKTREEYVKDFRHCFGIWDAADNSLARLNRTPSASRIRSTIEMCRVVYEAQRSLGHRGFEKFCKEIGLTKQSAIRKFIVFGETYPAILQYMRSVEPRQWFIVDLYLRIPSGLFPSSEGFAEMWKSDVTNHLLDADASKKALNMTYSHYELLPRAERRAAEKYAKKLLRTVPALRDPDQPVWLRGALGGVTGTAVLKAENVVAARVYPDTGNQWWCEVILRRGDGIALLRNDTPLPRRDHAVTCLEHYIGRIKGAQEHPLVSEFRKLGIDPERDEMLRVRHNSFGVRWVIVPTNEISTRARAFAEQVELENGPRVDKLTVAFIALYELAPKFLAGPRLLEVDSNSETDKDHFDYYLNAAAFALEHGARTIYDPSEEPNSADLHDLDFGPPTGAGLH
jgi:hypothetical protein